MSATAYPLQWPAGWPRAKRREQSRFDTSFAKARDGLADELDRMGARNVVLSTNVELRIDGQPYANKAEPFDPGVAVYFEYKGKSMTFACDRWGYVRDNIQAVRKTIEALRGIERWGASDMMERAFTGFTAVPDLRGEPWWEVLQVTANANYAEVQQAYRRLRSATHTDRTSDSDSTEFVRITQAWNTYQEQRQ